MASAMRASVIMRSLLLNGSRRSSYCNNTRACSTITNLLPISTPMLNNSLNKTSTLHHHQQQQNRYVLHSSGSRSHTTGPGGGGDLKWDLAAGLVSKPEITGALVPLAQLNFFQKLILPFTFTVMYSLDFLQGYMPWWMAIIATTATIRIAFFPLTVKQNVIGIRLYNIMPETQKLQVKLNEAMCSGNAYEANMARTKLKILYGEHNVSVKQRLLPLLIQAPMFMSMFFLLRKLATHPVESMTTGGALWFANLTVPDPFFILPTMACVSTFLLLEYGLEGTSGPLSGMGPGQKWFMRAMPLGLFAICYNFPAAIVLYWTTNNLFTLAYALLLKNKFVKQKLNIPPRLVHDPASLPLMNQTFSGQVTAAIDQGRAKRTTLDVRRLDDIAFKKAGVGPLRKTYKR